MKKFFEDYFDSVFFIIIFPLVVLLIFGLIKFFYF